MATLSNLLGSTFQGSTGATGPSGINGATGPIGLTGSTGATGPGVTTGKAIAMAIVFG